jgi:hypothetical protein
VWNRAIQRLIDRRPDRGQSWHRNRHHSTRQ